VAGPTGVYLSQHLEGALPAIALSAHSAVVTAIQNDTAGDMAFAQQVYGYGRPGDLLWALSTSGRSRNVVLAAATATAAGMKVLAFTGEVESPLGELASVTVRAPASNTPLVQELHLPIYHALCEAVEQVFFSR
jgi:D-sedoheptulose 7-phosphate isomerase